MKEDRHQNIVISVFLRKGIEEPWASERVARFIKSLGYKEITLKSDTQPAIIEFRNRDEDEDELRAWCLLEESENEQWALSLSLAVALALALALVLALCVSV